MYLLNTVQACIYIYVQNKVKINTYIIDLKMKTSTKSLTQALVKNTVFIFIL